MGQLEDTYLNIGIAADTLARATVPGYPREEVVIRITNGAIFIDGQGEPSIRVGTLGVEPSVDDWRRAVMFLAAQLRNSVA